MIIKAINELLYFYGILILIRIFLTWIPTIDWDAQPMKALRMSTDVYLDLFRSIIPPFGGLDFSPIIAIIVLQVLQVILTSFLGSIL
ncbi:YggT family protein [bacterium]|nr:YggT family protein [bacterium]